MEAEVPKKSRGDLAVWGVVVGQRQNHGEPVESGSPCGVFLECMWVAPKAVLRGWSENRARWTALEAGSSVAPFQGMGGGELQYYALRIRILAVASAQQEEARGCREAGGF